MAPKKDNPNLTRRQQAERIVRMRIIRAAVIATLAVVLFVTIVAVLYNAPKRNATANPTASAASAVSAIPTGDASAEATQAAITKNSDYARADDPVATITLSDGSAITVELYPAAAPNTVANFVELANTGYYDGLTFHRVISGFMIQGGDPKGDGTGGPGYAIKGEFTQNGVDNRLTHARGVISMARSSLGFDTAGSQFFLVHGDASYLDGQYAAFGEVTGGMDVVDRIASVKTGTGDKPVENVVIESITVDTRGIEYRVKKIED